MKLSAVTETREKGTEDDGIKGSTGCSIFPNKDDEKPLWGAYVRPTRRTNSKFLFCRFHSCGGWYGPCRIHGKLPFRLPNQMRAGRFLFPFRVVLFYEHLYYDFSGKKEICVPTFHLFFFFFGVVFVVLKLTLRFHCTVLSYSEFYVPTSQPQAQNFIHCVVRILNMVVSFASKSTKS